MKKTNLLALTILSSVILTVEANDSDNSTSPTNSTQSSQNTTGNDNTTFRCAPAPQCDLDSSSTSNWFDLLILKTFGQQQNATESDTNSN